MFRCLAKNLRAAKCNNRREMSLGKRIRSDTLVLYIKKESPDAVIPTKGTKGSAGYDLSRYLNDISPVNHSQ